MTFKLGIKLDRVQNYSTTTLACESIKKKQFACEY